MISPASNSPIFFLNVKVTYFLSVVYRVDFTHSSERIMSRVSSRRLGRHRDSFILAEFNYASFLVFRGVLASNCDSVDLLLVNEAVMVTNSPDWCVDQMQTLADILKLVRRLLELRVVDAVSSFNDT